MRMHEDQDGVQRRGGGEDHIGMIMQQHNIFNRDRHRERERESAHNIMIYMDDYNDAHDHKHELETINSSKILSSEIRN